MINELLRLPSPLNKLFTQHDCDVWIKRDDLIHPVISGNKSRKLTHFIEKQPAKLLMFGGAYSNHIHATAYVGKQLGIETIGIIRGQELTDISKHSPTLKDVSGWGMTLHFVTRQAYRDKDKLIEQCANDNALVVPEGGCDRLGAQGCREIMREISTQIEPSIPTTIISACGTGTTLAGLIDGAYLHFPNTNIIGIPVLKGADFLENEIRTLSQYHTQVNWRLDHRFHDGGYGKVSLKTMEMMQTVQENYELRLDKIYTAKAFRAMLALLSENALSEQVVFYHSGGLQGNRKR